MNVKKEYIKKIKAYLKQFDYEGKVNQISQLRKYISDYPEDVNTANSLRGLEMDVKLINSLASSLTERELAVISFRYFKTKDGKPYQHKFIGEALGYSVAQICRIEQVALGKLSRNKYGDEALE